jgi:hypothetical protein
VFRVVLLIFRAQLCGNAARFLDNLAMVRAYAAWFGAQD